MPLSGCTNGLVVSAVVALLLLPAQYYIPDLGFGNENLPEPKQLLVPVPANTSLPWVPVDLPPVDLFLTVSLIIFAFITYVFDWIQRKLMEKRILKLNQYLQECVDQLRAWDVRQEQLEATLRMVQNATSEYNLLLYLLLRHHHISAAVRKPSHFFDKEYDDLNFTTNPMDGLVQDNIV